MDPSIKLTTGRCCGCGAELPGRQRKWCSERCRKLHYEDGCIDCGAPAWGNRCLSCSLELLHKKQHIAMTLRRIAILEMRAEGMLNTEIATRLKTTLSAVDSDVYRMRADGVEVPVSTYDASHWASGRAHA